MEKNKVVVTTTNFNVNEVCEKLHIVFQEKIKASFLKFKVAMHSNIPLLVEADRRRFEQIYSNALQIVITLANVGTKVQVLLKYYSDKNFIKAKFKFSGKKLADLEREQTFHIVKPNWYNVFLNKLAKQLHAEVKFTEKDVPINGKELEICFKAVETFDLAFEATLYKKPTLKDFEKKFVLIVTGDTNLY